MSSTIIIMVIILLDIMITTMVRPTVLENILNDLFHVFRYETCSNLRQVKIMSSHPPILTTS